MAENLTRGTMTNLKWTYGSTLVSAVLQLGYTAVMGRLLTPADFGLVAMALVFLRFGSYFAEMGVGPALIQRPTLSEREIRAGHTSGTLLGLLFAAVIALAAPLAHLLFDAPGVVPVVRLMAVTFLINGAGLTAFNLLQRDLRFRTRAYVEVLSHVVGYMLVGVVFALNGAGPYSLVAAAIGQAVVQTVLSYAAVRHPVAPLLAWRELRELYGFGGRVTAISFLEFLGLSLDALVIGRFAGPAPLGQYNRASLIVNLPFQRAIVGLSNVLFATLSRIQSELARVRRAYLTALRAAAALLLPTAAGIAVAAHEIVRVLLGTQWDAAAAVLPLLAFAVAVDLLYQLGGVVLEALAVLNRKLVLQAAFVVVLAVLLLANTDGDLRGYAAAVVVAQVLRLGAAVLLTGRSMAIDPREQLRAFVGPALSAAVVAAAIGLVTATLRGVAPDLVVLLTQMLTGAVVLGLLFLVGPLAGVRREATARLVRAGYFRNATEGDGLVAKLLR